MKRDIVVAISFRRGVEVFGVEGKIKERIRYLIEIQFRGALLADKKKGCNSGWDPFLWSVTHRQATKCMVKAGLNYVVLSDK